MITIDISLAELRTIHSGLLCLKTALLAKDNLSLRKEKYIDSLDKKIKNAADDFSSINLKQSNAE